MSERDDLLRGIREHPEDDAPRLVFADWLDEHHPGGGKAAKDARDWAALIRREVEAARTPRTDPRFWDLYPWSPTADKPARAAMALLPTSLRAAARYSRGFPGGLWISARNFLTRLDTIAACPAPLASLDLRSVSADLRDIVARPELGQFRRLSVEGARVGDAEAGILAASPHVAHLTALEMGPPLGTAGLSALVESPHLMDLRKLDLMCVDGSGGLDGLIESPTPRSLESLQLCARGDVAVDLVALVGARSLAGLRHLSLLLESVDPRVADVLASQAMPRLTDLMIPGRTLVGASAFYRSECFRRLTALNVLGVRGDPFWEGVPDDPGPPGLSLRCYLHDPQAGDALARSPIIGRCVSLEVGHSHMTADNLGTLANSPFSRHLRCLSVQALDQASAPLDVMTLTEFADSPHLAELVELMLPGPFLRDDGLRALTEATFAGSLRVLWLGDCSRLTDREVGRLADPSVFPKLKVLQLTGHGFANAGRLSERLSERFGRPYVLQ